MITLAAFGPGFGLPDPSPFVTKAEVLLKMSGVPFEKKTLGLRKAPKGKLPYIVDDGETIADSTFIRRHLERKYGVDFDKGLTQAQRGAAWAAEKMLEDQLYWVIIKERWLEDANFAKGPAVFFASIPAPIRYFVVRMVRGGLHRTLQGQGIGRHSPAEIDELGVAALTAISNMLGDNEYLMGSNICGADATVYAFMISALCPHFETRLRVSAQKLPNLASYCERMGRRFHPAAG